MTSAVFTVNGSLPTGAVSVAAESTVNLALSSTTGVRSVAWSIEGNHSPAATNPTITPTGTPSGVTASFVMPAGTAQAYIVQCMINGGIDLEGNIVSGYTVRAVIGVIDAASYVPLASGETYERSATHGWVPTLNDRIGAAAMAAGYAAPTGSVANRLTYSTAANSNAWSTAIWSDGTYIKIGAAGDAFPATGEIRLAPGKSITTCTTTGASVTLMYASASGEDVTIVIGENSHHVNYAVESGGTHSFYTGLTCLATITDAGLKVSSSYSLDLTGAQTITSSGSIERIARGTTAVDAGADASPVSVVSYTVPTGYAATLNCWVRGERNLDQVPMHDAQWTIKVYIDQAGDVVEYSTPVTPDSIADPVNANVDVTYTLAGTTVTLYKKNTSSTAMRFAGQIEIKLDVLVGTLV